MSNITRNGSIGFNKRGCEIFKTIGFDLKENEKLHTPFRRESGTLFMANGKISKFDGSLGKTLGDIKGFSLEELFIDDYSSKIKLYQLETLGKADVRLMDGAGSIFWARLSRSDDLIHVEDIDIEKQFQLSSEDLIESYERGEDLSAFSEGQTYQ